MLIPNLGKFSEVLSVLGGGSAAHQPWLLALLVVMALATGSFVHVLRSASVLDPSGWETDAAEHLGVDVGVGFLVGFAEFELCLCFEHLIVLHWMSIVLLVLVSGTERFVSYACFS